jgi:hypothetical protein
MTLVAYGVPIYNAITRGDAARLRQAIDTASKVHVEQGGDLKKAIRAGEAALKKLKAKR